MLYDTGTDVATNILTHSRALAEHPDFSLAGGVDPLYDRRYEFESEFGLPATDSIETMLLETRPDLVVISTHTRMHASALSEVLKVHSPRAVLIEKPLATNRVAAERMIKACRETETEIFVNYIRRAYPAYRKVRNLINQGSFEGPFKGVVWYSGGILNSGSHMVNLLDFWFGEVLETRVTSKARSTESEFDPDIWIRLNDCEVHVVSTPPSRLSYVGAELIGTNGRLSVEGASNECIWLPVIPNPIFSGHISLSSSVINFELDWLKSQWFVLTELTQHLKLGQGSLCTGEQALATLNALEPQRST